MCDFALGNRLLGRRVRRGKYAALSFSATLCILCGEKSYLRIHEDYITVNAYLSSYCPFLLKITIK